MFLPGESQGRGSLVGCRLWGLTESDTTEATNEGEGSLEYCLSWGCRVGYNLELNKNNSLKTICDRRFVKEKIKIKTAPVTSSIFPFFLLSLHASVGFIYFYRIFFFLFSTLEALLLLSRFSRVRLCATP